MAVETEQYSPVGKRSPYRQFKIGELLRFPLYTPNPDGTVSVRQEEAIIEAVKGGGFVGRVLILKDKPYAIKTSVPDAWHDLWRRINWGFRDFPSQVDELENKLNVVSSNLIADVLPSLTNGRFIAPHSFGYTRFPNQYVQVIEKMAGRPPRYDTQDNEFAEFQQAQEELTVIGLEIGLEHSAQVYKLGSLTNPFGMANLWKNPECNQKIWLDTLPGIPHKGWVWPWYRFRFHHDVRNWFYYPPKLGSQEITFNRIHTKRFLETISKRRHKFTDELYQQIFDNLHLYEQLWAEKQSQPIPSRNFGGAALAVGNVIVEQIPKPLNLVKNTITTPFKVIFNPNRLALAGMEQAFQAGVIDQKELYDVKSNLSPDISAARTMAIFYEGYSWFLSKPAELIAYASILGVGIEEVKSLSIFELISYAVNQLQDPDKAAALGLAFAGFKAYSGLVRRTGTHLIGSFHEADTSKARLLTMIPYVGDHSALVFQAASSAKGEAGRKIWHYTFRNFVAGLSSLPIVFQDGGWGSEREGRFWIKGEKIVQQLQSLPKRFKSLTKEINSFII